MYKFLSSVFAFGTVNGLDINMHWPAEGRPVVQVSLQGDFRRHWMQLDFSSDSISLFPSFRNREFPRDRQRHHTFVKVYLRQFFHFDLESEVPFPVIEDPLAPAGLIGSIGIGFNSVFSRTVGIALLVPHDDVYKFIANRVNISEYCVPESVGYVSAAESGLVRGRVTISLDGWFHESNLMDIKIDPFSEKSSLRRPQIESLSYHLQRAVELQRDFPKLVIEMFDVKFELTLDDYASPREGEGQRLNVGIADTVIIGKDILRNIGVILDYQRNRYGFCDPLFLSTN